MRTALMIVLGLISLIMIVVVMLQESNSDGLGAVSGGAEQLFGKKKAKGYAKKMERLTTICAVLFIVVTLILVIME